MTAKPVTTGTPRYTERSDQGLGASRKKIPVLPFSVSLYLCGGFLSLLLFLSGCGKPPLYQEQGYVFGTLVEVSIYGEDEAKARAGAAMVMAEFQRLHDLLHAWQPSELSRLNAALAQGKAARVSPEVAALLQDAAQFSAQSHGRFNPAIGGLIAAWGFQADDFKAVLPDEKRIMALVEANPQMSDLVFLPLPREKKAGDTSIQLPTLFSAASPASGKGESVSSRNRAVQIDLGGYAKGYALDRAAAILKQQGIRNALVNIGGNVLALGAHGSRPWRVGIQHPRQPGPLAMLELHDGEAVGTSGDYQRYFELGGQRYCHLIDPATGQPVQGVQAVTVLTHGERAGLLSDVMSKPLFVAGASSWREAARELGQESALLVDAAGRVHLTPTMQKRLEFADDKTLRVVEP